MPLQKLLVPRCIILEKRKYTPEEVEEWRQQKGRRLAYFNKEDTNMLVPKAYGFGWTFNWANPLTWLFGAVLILIIVLLAAHRFV